MASRKAYPSDLSDAEWKIVEPLIPAIAEDATNVVHERREIINGILYVLSNNGTFDAYNLKSGDELYRQRLPLVGSGFSASPVASDGKIYLSNEDGEIIVVTAGEKFAHKMSKLDKAQGYFFY